MASDVFLGSRDFDRDRFGAPIVIGLDGKTRRYGRASNFAAPLEDRKWIERFQKVRVAEGAALRPDLVAKAAAARDDARLLGECAEEMFKAGGGEAAALLGTAIHDAIAQLNQGTVTLEEVREEFRAHAVAWQDAVRAHGFEIVSELVECKMVCDEFEVAGSADCLLRRVSDGRYVVADLKTGKQIADRPIAYAVQCFLYANSMLYNVATGQRDAIDIDTSVAYLFHIPAAGQGCDVYEIDLTGATTQAACLARDIHNMRRNYPRVSPRKPNDTPAPDEASAERREWVKGRIQTILSTSEEAKAELLRRWPPDMPGFKSDHRHTDTELNTIVTVLCLVEANHDIPFGPSDPDIKRVNENAVVKVLFAFPGSVVINDEGDVSPEEIEELKKKLDSLPQDARNFVSQVTKEANQAHRPLSVSQRPSPRRKKIADVLVDIARYEDPEVARAILCIVEPEAATQATLGRVFGGLRIEQAECLEKIVHALDSGVLTLVFNDDGRPEVRGDVSAVSTAA
jgi:hypothetical protein